MKKKNLILSYALAAAFGLAIAPAGLASDQTFLIKRYEVVGNSLLSQSEVEALLTPLTGEKRVYGDIQKALEALENAYRKAGYGTVQVYVPEQELTSGVVRLQVTESVIGKIVITGNQHFDRENIENGLRALKVGQPPNLRKLSESIQLSNENPAKQVEVSLGVAAEEGKVDAKVAVTDKRPYSAFFTVDNTGTAATGKWRTGIAFQHANLFDRDHVATLAYTTSPDSPSGVDVHLYSLGYRIPLYGLGDSIDIIYGKSSVNTPSTSPTLGGALGIVGKGDVMGLRWNHHFPRRGEYSSKLVLGIDNKYIDSRCTDALGNPVSIAPPTPPLSTCVPYTTRPLSATYYGQRQRPGQAFDYSVGLAYNLAHGTNYTNIDGRTDRYSYLTPGNRATRDNFTILRFGASYLQAFANGWQVRIAGSGQYAPHPLVAAEQFGMAGANTVRGFNERAVAADSGVLLNTELYTSDFLPQDGKRGNLRGLLFIDMARGFNSRTGATLIPAAVDIASAGVGVRYAYAKTFSMRLDVAQVLDAGNAVTERRGDWRGQLSMLFGF